MKQICTIVFINLFVLISVKVSAQTTVTFNLNLKPQLEDSVFIPNRDKVYLVGSTYPLRLNRPLMMRDEEPIDSIYTIDVMFNRDQLNKLVEYNFMLNVNSNQLKEDIPRRLEIRGNEILDALYFNSFAW